MVCTMGYVVISLLVVIALLIGLDQAKLLGDMAAVYYVSVAAIVAAYFGTQSTEQQK